MDEWANLVAEAARVQAAQSVEFRYALLVIGANDTVNPAAKQEPGSPLARMPIIGVRSAAQVIMMKRSMASGFAGIESELFYDSKMSMLFGKARESLTKLVSEVKAL